MSACASYSYYQAQVNIACIIWSVYETCNNIFLFILDDYHSTFWCHHLCQRMFYLIPPSLILGWGSTPKRATVRGHPRSDSHDSWHIPWQERRPFRCSRCFHPWMLKSEILLQIFKNPEIVSDWLICLCMCNSLHTCICFQSHIPEYLGHCESYRVSALFLSHF